MELHPITTEQDYDAALRAIEALWTAPAGSPEAEQLEILVTLAMRRRLHRGLGIATDVLLQ